MFFLGVALVATMQPTAVADISSLRIEATDDGYQVIRLELGFDVQIGDALVVTMPERWGPEERLNALVTDLHLTDASGQPVGYTQSGSVIRIGDLDPGRYSLNYTISQDYDGLPQWGAHRVPGMRPVTQTEFATLIGRTILPTLSNEAAHIQVTLDATEGAFNRPISTGGTQSLRYSDIADGIIVLGDFRYQTLNADGVTLRQAIRGEWALPDETVAASARAVLGIGSELFEDPIFDQYFIALTPLPDIPGNSAVIGSGFNESFFILATQSAAAENLIHTIVHEVLHEWIPRRAGRTDAATDPSRAWFTEGFTEYFTQRILLEAGLISLEDFAANYNELLQNYLSSPVNALPARELNTRIFESRDTERLPYQRGAILALSWDSALKARGETGLADVIATLIDAADVARTNGEDPELTDAFLQDVLESRLGDRFWTDFERYIVSGKRIDLDTITLPACLVFEGEAGRESISVSGTNSECVEFITRR